MLICVTLNIRCAMQLKDGVTDADTSKYLEIIARISTGLKQLKEKIKTDKERDNERTDKKGTT